MKIITATLLSALLCACSSPGGSSLSQTPVTTQGAQEVGNDQGTATATEGVSATNTVTPSIINAFGMKTMKVTRAPDGTETVEMEGSEGSITVSGGVNAGVHIGEGQTSTASSGGGAAGGTGGAKREDQ